MTPDALTLPRIAVTLGDPGGIGPEVVRKALSIDTLRHRARWVVIGPESSWAGAIEGVEFLAEPATTPPGGWPASPNAASGEVSFQAVRTAIRLASLSPSDPHRVNAIVTAPINKEAWSLAGHGRFPGHTELLADGFGIPDSRFGMFFHAPTGAHALNVILATVHVPLSKVPELLTHDRVLAAITLGHQACIDLGIASPRVAVCGLNPHAGEHGLLGSEDDAVIRPAIETARRAGIDASGPYPGDTVFHAALRGKHDLVVAMYHDQGLIPVKLLAFDNAVNVTVGLPVPRTSPDHGTAFDIAGQGIANPGSMVAAMDLAVTLVAKAARKESR